MLAPAQKMRGFRLVDDDGVDLGMLEADALQRVGELDVDAEIVGVEFELVVVRPQAGVFLDVHRQRRDRAVEGELPVLVLIGRGFERDGRGLGAGAVCSTAASLHQFKRAFKSWYNAKTQLIRWPRSANGTDRRIEILKSAAAAFRRRGYHGASVDEIASALEMTKGNLYYYFRNKEEILFACHDYSLDVLLALMDRGAGRVDAARRQAAQADSRVHPHDARRAAGHGAHARPAGAVAAAAEADHRQARSLRPRPARDHPAGHRSGPVSRRRSEDDRLCDHGRGQLDHEVVRSGGSG